MDAYFPGWRWNEIQASNEHHHHGFHDHPRTFAGAMSISVLAEDVAEALLDSLRDVLRECDLAQLADPDLAASPATS